MILIFFYVCGVVREKTFCKAIGIFIFFSFLFKRDFIYRNTITDWLTGSGLNLLVKISKI